MRDRHLILSDLPPARDFERGHQGIDGTGLTLSVRLMLEVLLDVRDLLAAKK
jgi:hypothetical protein